MKPRENWRIGTGDANAVRTDGVMAAYLFPDHPKPYAVKAKDGQWLKRWSDSKPRQFRTLERALIAADAVWPFEK